MPVFLSEMGAPRYRGALNNMFQLATSCGILLAQIVNFAVKDIGPFQWRVSLAVAGDCQSLLVFSLSTPTCITKDRNQSTPLMAVSAPRLLTIRPVPDVLYRLFSTGEFGQGLGVWCDTVARAHEGPLLPF